MVTKTISIDARAYNILAAARLSEKESFSKVIHRAKWDAKRKTCGDILDAMSDRPPLSEETLTRLDRAQEWDAQNPPPNRRADTDG